MPTGYQKQITPYATAVAAVKRCPHCRVLKPTVDYYANRTRPDGLSWDCRACRLADQRRRYRRRQAAGACGRCGRPVVPGYAACRACLRQDRRATGSRPWRTGRRGRPPGPTVSR